MIFGPNEVLVVGVETLDDGSAKVYIGARYQCIYALVEDPEEAANIQRQWDSSFMGHLLMEKPPDDCLGCDKPAEA